MPMYEDRPRLPVGRESSGLEQGDVIRGLFVPDPVTDESFIIRGKGASYKFVKPRLPPHDILAGEKDGLLREMSKVPRAPFCVVVSNSCDNSGGDDLVLFAEVNEFTFSPPVEVELRAQISTLVHALAPRCSNSGCSAMALKQTPTGHPWCEGCAPSDPNTPVTEHPHATLIQAALAAGRTGADAEAARRAAEWMDISKAGTGHGTSFYMPAHPNAEFGFQRSEADLRTLFALTPSYVDYCLAQLGARRLFGLTPEAVRHLERSLDFLFARHPRDDHAWPSRSDLELKLVWLDQEIARGSARQHEYKAERDLLRSQTTSAARPVNDAGPVLVPPQAGADSGAGPEPEG